MDFSSIEVFSEDDTEALYQEAVSRGIELAGVNCTHSYYTMSCSCTSSGGRMDAWYGSTYRWGYMSYGSQAYASSYHGPLSSCYWEYTSAYSMYKIHCHAGYGYTTNYTNIDGWYHNAGGFSGNAHVGLGPSSHCR